MKAIYAYQLMDLKEFWLVKYSTIETGSSTEGPFLTEKEAEIWVEKYIANDPKYYRGYVIHKVVT